MSFRFVFDGIALSPDTPEREAVSIVEKRLKRAGIDLSQISLDIFKKSVDARKREDIKLVYSVAATAEDFRRSESNALLKLGAREISAEKLTFSKGLERMSHRPAVVGMGPAGMFCALLLAEQGYKPIIIDRGDRIEDRVKALERFYETHVLDTESNIQFGAGGAGTFSDGKLLTRVNDPKCSYVLETFARFGAPEDITVKAKPHIGTDILRNVVDNILRRIEELGGSVIYRCRLESISERSDGGVSLRTTKGDMVCSCAVLALGHSARDTSAELLKSGFDIIAKPISVGVRIEHKRENIERALYGSYAGHPALGSAEYALSDTKGERGVYTFCMCPGGEVVAGASEEGGVVVNGMSSRARDGENSNCAVAVSVQPEDFERIDGSLVLGAIDFQRKIERAAFCAGGGGYSAPVQTVGDFMDKKSGQEPYDVMPTYMGGSNFKTASMDDIFPGFVTKGLRYGLSSFDRKISGFASGGALLTGAETRTSSPLRLLRGESLVAIGKRSIYPCGEGAGYAGGITSAALDGVKVALAIIERFAPLI